MNFKKETPIKKVFFSDNNESYNFLFDRFVKYNIPFSVTHTGYTIKIENKLISYLITERDISNKVFIAMNKIKKDYDNSNIIIDEIPKEIINYYNILPKECFIKDCFLVDFNSAYPRALLNEKIITLETFQYMEAIKKHERLMSIGALASKKIKFNYSPENNFIEYIDEPEFIYDNIYAQIYFYACLTIGELLTESEKILKDSFLFSWFDGIYFKNNFVPEKLVNHFSELNYPCKIIQLDFFENKIIDNFCHISWKEKNKEIKKIIIPVIKKNNNFAKIKSRYEK